MKGFTLIELVLSVLLGVMIIILLVPLIINSHERAQMNDLASRARSIHIALFGIHDFVPMKETEHQERFAKVSSSEFSTSTDLFREMVSSGFLNTTYAFFSGMGVPACTSSNSANFTAENNAWCIVADLETISDSETPILFTRNVNLNNIGPNGRATLTDDRPMGKKHWIFATKSGATLVVDGNAIDDWYTGLATNKVLRP